MAGLPDMVALSLLRRESDKRKTSTTKDTQYHEGNQQHHPGMPVVSGKRRGLC
jgi:hypothetical protein